MCFTMAVVFTVSLYFVPLSNGKTVSGVFSSDGARQGKGQYITKFLFHGEKPLVVCRLEDVSTAVQRKARLLLFQGLEEFNNLHCQDRLSRAKLSIYLNSEEHNLSVPHMATASLRAWHLMYADQHTCQEGGASSDSLADLRFQIVLLNLEGEGNPLDHFSAEVAGLLGFYSTVILAYLVATLIYVRPLWHALLKGGPMRTALKALSAALLLQISSTLCNYLHLQRYSLDGIGAPFMGSLAEVCDMVSQAQMLYLLLGLSAGWTLSGPRKSQKPLQWDATPASTALTLGSVALQGALLMWEQVKETEHHSYHVHHSMAGPLLAALRIGLALLIASILYRIITDERSTFKKEFYLSFAKGSFLWFLCHPVLELFSVLLREHQREKAITIGVLLCQSISVVVLYRLFLYHSLYWGVSSLPSVSLPLAMSRGHRSPQRS